MTTLQALRDLAAILTNIRPTWDLIATQNYLAQHRQMPFDDLAAAAVACASNPANRTPASLQWLTPVPQPSPERKDDHRHEPTCYVCGRTRHRCQQLGDHDYETADRAEANAVGRQLTAPGQPAIEFGPDLAPLRPKAWR